MARGSVETIESLKQKLHNDLINFDYFSFFIMLV
jgi:hypothetical protein